LKRFFLNIALLFLSIEAFPQSILWEKLFVFPGNETSSFNTMDSTSDGKIIVAGNASTLSNQLFYTKYDLNGNVIWTKYGQSNNAGGNNFIKLLNNGEFIAAACKSTGPGSSFIILQKIDMSGDTLPHWRYSDGLQNIGTSKIVVLPNGDILNAGGSNGNFALLKVDSTGNLIWLRDYPYYSMGNDMSYDVILNHRGNYILSGSSYSNYTGVYSYHRKFMELTPDGDTVRTKVFVLENNSIDEDQTYMDEFTLETSGYDYVFSTSIDSLNTSNQVVGNKSAITLIDTNFNVKWTTILPQPTIFSLPLNIYELQDSTLAVILTEATNKFHLFKLDLNGGILSQKTFTSGLCSNLELYTWKIFNDSSFTIVGRCGTDSYIARIDSIGGTFVSHDTCKTFTATFTAQQTGDSLQFFNTSNGGYDYARQSTWKFADSSASNIFNYKIKIPFDVDSVWARLTATNGYGCTGTVAKKVKVTPVTALTMQGATFNVFVYPNPFSQSTIFNINGGSGKIYKLSIINSLGETTQAHEIKNQNTFTLNRADIPSGLYLYVLSDGEGKSTSGKLVVE
jgi:hypothetical protein